MAKVNYENVLFSKVPPSSVNLEELVLGAMLNDNAMIVIVREILSWDDFYKDAHQIICSAIYEVSEYAPVDIPLVLQTLSSWGKTNIITPYDLVTLSSKATTNTNIKNYCLVIKQKSISRKLIETSGTILTRSYMETEDVFDVLEEAEFGLRQITNELAELKITPMSNIAMSIIDKYKLINGDCVDAVKTLEDNSIDYTFFSPPFGALYVFSDNPKDMSNVSGDAEFMEHFKFLIPELFRTTKNGRLVSLHIMQGTTLLGRDGMYSLKDFRGELIRAFQQAGFYFHAENMIRKDPKTAAIRTKNRQLMHGTTKIDSSIVRPGLADYIITFRKPGENEVPIQNNIPFDLWCKIAEPVWIDIQEGDTLEFRSAKDNKDERHITPTQLQPIQWCYMMWCNKGETVLSPFSGIASEGYVAIKTGRKYIGVELKESYFDISVKNLNNAILETQQLTLI